MIFQCAVNPELPEFLEEGKSFAVNQDSGSIFYWSISSYVLYNKVARYQLFNNTIFLNNKSFKISLQHCISIVGAFTNEGEVVLGQK